MTVSYSHFDHLRTEGLSHKRTHELVRYEEGRRIVLARVSPDDPKTYHLQKFFNDTAAWCGSTETFVEPRQSGPHDSGFVRRKDRERKGWAHSWMFARKVDKGADSE